MEISLQKILLIILSTYGLNLLLISLSRQDGPVKSQRDLHNLRLVIDERAKVLNDSSTQVKKIFRFSDPVLAYKILSQLNILYGSNEDAGYIADYSSKIPYINLKKDDNYCDKHTKYIVQFPEVIFEETHFIADTPPQCLMRKKVIPSMGNDIQPHIGYSMPKNITKLFDIRPQVSAFVSLRELYVEKRIGKHLSCLTQISNHFPSRQVLDKKNLLVEAINEYAKRYDDRPHCFDFNKFFPKTYLLYNQQECKAFFKVFNSPEYQALKAERRIVYVKKLGANVHMGEGVDPVNVKQELELRKVYGNGTKCGQITTKVFIQEFIHNPLLIHGRKFDFRMYLLFASTNPLIAYYHDGLLRVSLDEYDINSDDKKVLLTNLALSHNVYDSVKDGTLYKGMDNEGLKHAQQWSFSRLQNYLLEQGIITDPDWLDNYLRPQFKKALVHLLRFTLKSVYRHSSLFQLYGLDFMLDTDLNLWFIEANSKPGQDGYSIEIEKQMMNMFQDEIEIAIGLLRSRTKRIIHYVNAIIEEGLVKEDEHENVVIKDLNHRRVVFEKISQNWFENEFQPKSSNGFSKIIDENYSGVDKYQNLITKECL